MLSRLAISLATPQPASLMGSIPDEATGTARVTFIPSQCEADLIVVDHLCSVDQLVEGLERCDSNNVQHVSICSTTFLEQN